MATEQVRIHKDGVGNRQGEHITSTSQKFWYPFEPDVIRKDTITEDYQVFKQPGGHTYKTGAKSGSKGTYIQPGVKSDYDGRHKPEHINHKYAIFAGNPTTCEEKLNRYKKSSANKTLSKQIVSPFAVHGKGYVNKTTACHSWSIYSTNYGCPLPVYGVSFDLYMTEALRYTVSYGDDKEETTASTTFARDKQINQMHALYWQQGASDYTSKLLLPNGDNWGGKRNASERKYIFRNSQNMEDGAGEELLSSSSQWASRLKDDGTEDPWTIKAFIANDGAPPANSIFMGITFSMAFGHAGDTNKTHLYHISNLGIITKAARDIMKDDDRYHGTLPKHSNLPYYVLPPLQSKDSIFSSSQKLYGPMQNW